MHGMIVYSIYLLSIIKIYFEPGSVCFCCLLRRADCTFVAARKYMNLAEYLPVLLFILIGVLVGVVPLVLGYFFGTASLTRKKIRLMSVVSAFDDARMQFDVRYYLVAILFILFDLKWLSWCRGPWCSRKWGLWRSGRV